MATLLIRNPKAIGFMGEDTYGELNFLQQEMLTFEALIDTKMRFEFGCKIDRAEATLAKMDGGEALVVASSYEKRVRRIAKDLGFGLKEVVVLGGSVESAQEDDPEIDMIFDLVDSGRTMTENGVMVLETNCPVQDKKISIGAVWCNQPAPQSGMLRWKS
jgi:ATP phosphoribosyltransferase